MKFAPVLLVVFAIVTFVLTLVINKALGTTNTQYAKSFAIWIFLQLPGLLILIMASDKIEKLQSQLN
jgi:uncharacterized membrane protein YidH (DUF202 family)